MREENVSTSSLITGVVRLSDCVISGLFVGRIIITTNTLLPLPGFEIKLYEI